MTQLRQTIKETISDYVKEKENSIQFLMNEMIEELNFQKNFLLTNLQLKEDFISKLSYVEVYQKNLVKGLYGGNSVIIENYSQNFNKRVIVESIYDFVAEIERFNNFIIESVSHVSGVLSEQLSMGGYSSPMTTQTIKDAVSYIKEYGITQIMEGLRSALLSGVGTAIQIALSFTGVGAISNEVAWGIMTLYDGYQLFVNDAMGSMGNLIIDLICLLTAGSIGKQLKGLVNFGGKTIEGVLKYFMESGAGKVISPFLERIQGGASSLSSFLGQSSTFMETKMGINWVGKILTSVKTFFTDMVTKLGNFLGKGISKLTTPLVRGGASLGAKFEVAIFNELSKKTDQELSKLAGRAMTQIQIKTAEKYANDYLKEKPTNEALKILDQKFGTGMSKLYTTYLALTKLQSSRSKIAGGMTSVDLGVDALRMDPTHQKTEKYAQKIQKNLTAPG